MTYRKTISLENYNSNLLGVGVEQTKNVTKLNADETGKIRIQVLSGSGVYVVACDDEPDDFEGAVMLTQIDGITTLNVSDVFPAFESTNWYAIPVGSNAVVSVAH